MAFCSLIEQRDAFVPAWDHLTLSETKHDGLATFEGAVEHFSVQERPSVVHPDIVAGLCLWALARPCNVVIQPLFSNGMREVSLLEKILKE